MGGCVFRNFFQRKQAHTQWVRVFLAFLLSRNIMIDRSFKPWLQSTAYFIAILQIALVTICTKKQTYGND